MVYKRGQQVSIRKEERILSQAQLEYLSKYETQSIPKSYLVER